MAIIWHRNCFGDWIKAGQSKRLTEIVASGSCLGEHISVPLLASTAPSLPDLEKGTDRRRKQEWEEKAEPALGGMSR